MACGACQSNPFQSGGCCPPTFGVPGLYVGQMAAGQEQAIADMINFPGGGKQPTIPENPTQEQCDEWWGYLENLDATGFPMDAVIANMRGELHSNTRFLEQILTLAWYDKENVYRCARKTGADMITAAVAGMTPEEKAAERERTRKKLQELQAQGKFIDGKLVIQDPGELRSNAAYLQIQAALDCEDSLFCGSQNVLGMPIPKWALWAVGGLVAFKVYKAIV